MRSYQGLKTKQREVGVHTIVIRVPKPEFSAQMAEMRRWLAKYRVDRALFTSKPYENIVSVFVQFENDHEAEAISDVIFVLQGDAGWSIQLVGRYHDTLHHYDGTWRFHRRAAEFMPPHPG